jgi:stage II sporulation protein AA (anti-sigma F factor antagonist)
MQIVKNRVDEIPLLHVVGDIDHETAAELSGAMNVALEGGSSRIILDLEQCPYIDSGGISVILQVLRRVKETGWFAVLAPNTDVLRLLTLVGVTIDPAFRVLETLDDIDS